MPQENKLSHWHEAVVLGAMLLAAPLLIVGSLRALATNCNDPRLWLPSGFEEADRYDWLQQHFGSDEITVVSWPGCRLSDQRIDRLAEALAGGAEPRLFERVVTGPQVFRQLTSGRIGLPPLVARGRLRGSLVGPDGETTCLVLYLSKEGAKDRPAAVKHVYRTALETCGIARDQLRLGGPTVDAATIDVESQRMLLPLAGLSVVVAFFITWRQFRNLKLAMIVVFGGLYTGALALTILYVAGGHMNLVMTMLPPLVYVLTISTSIHMVNYYRDAFEESGPASASLKSLVLGWKPCALASGTTALGLVSLATSDIMPVKLFGIYSAIGIAVGLVVTLLYLPAALTVCPPCLEPKRNDHERSSPRADNGVATWVSAFICRRHGSFVTASLALMAVTGVGLLFLQSTVKLQYRFGRDSRIIADYRWLESHVGPLVPLEVVLDFPPETTTDVYDRLALVDHVQQGLAEIEEVGATVSAADFVPHLPTGHSFREIAASSHLRRRLAENQRMFYDAHWVADGAQGHQLWRITIRAAALGDVDFGRFTSELKDHVEPLLADHPHVQATYTGMIPLIYKAQRELLNDLVESFLLAFGVIALVMMFVLGGPSAGLLAMLPNVFPVVITFGLMGWFHVWIEIGTVMTASAALGIAVDDTFHYLCWFRRASRRGLDRPQAIQLAYERCGRAMFQTTFICACGLLVFSLSSFMPIVRFSRLMAALLAVALVGDLVFLPAILACPLGKVFVRRQDRPSLGSERSQITEHAPSRPRKAA